MEIERKFLVLSDAYKPLSTSHSRIVQGYIATDGSATVRIRLRGERAYLTIKGPSADGGLSRYEWETEIAPRDALDLLHLCKGGVVDKTRWLVPAGRHTFEVDEFHGASAGLVVAEVELTAPDEAYAVPPFLGREVTGERRFYNSHLLRYPYKDWTEAEKH